jgi:hypothetical protein
MRRKDQLRATKLKHVARRIKHESSKARRLTPVKRAAEAERTRPQAAVTDPQTVRLDQLRAEANYHRQCLDLYRARLYGGRATNLARLEEFQRASDTAAERLRRASDTASPARPPDQP